MADDTAAYAALQNQLTVLSNSGKMEMKSQLEKAILKLGSSPSERELAEFTLSLKRSGLVLGRKYREGASTFSEAAFRKYASDRIVNKVKIKEYLQEGDSVLLGRLDYLTKQYSGGEITLDKLKSSITSAVGDAITNSGRQTTRSLIEGAATGLKILKEPSACDWCFETAIMWEDNGSKRLSGFHSNCRCQIMPDLTIVSFVI